MFATKGKVMWILLIFIAIPLIEIALFVQIGGHIGVIGTLAEILFTAALGLVLMRLEPHRNAQDVRAALDRDASPASPLAHSALRLIGAVLLVLPGFLTDALGLLLLVPPLRMLILARLLLRIKTVQTRGQTQGQTRGAVIIEGDYEPHTERQDNTDTPPTLPPHPPRSGGPENRD